LTSKDVVLMGVVDGPLSLSETVEFFLFPFGPSITPAMYAEYSPLPKPRTTLPDLSFAMTRNDFSSEPIKRRPEKERIKFSSARLIIFFA
jgi:hypothetical protein